MYYIYIRQNSLKNSVLKSNYLYYTHTHTHTNQFSILHSFKKFCVFINIL